MTAFLAGLSAGKIWAEMSTTDEAEAKRLGAKVKEKGGAPVDCPVSGGCHRAASGNISIFAGCDRETFERMLPILTAMGRRILHTGELGQRLGAEGCDQLSGHGQSADLFGSPGDLQEGRHGPERGLRSHSHLLPATPSCMKPKAR